MSPLQCCLVPLALAGPRPHSYSPSRPYHYGSEVVGLFGLVAGVGVGI